MSAKATLSSRGQLVIPKDLREKMGVHCGSELILQLTNKNSLEISPIKKDISFFFGLGKGKVGHQTMSVEDIDRAIIEAVTKNDRN